MLLAVLPHLVAYHQHGGNQIQQRPAQIMPGLDNR
jgi:hypothetical protein